MKQCPGCQSQYTDDTLQFCLQDGSPLQYVSNSQINTVAFVEQETVVGNRQSNRINTPPPTNPTNWNPNQYQSGAGFQPPAKKSGTPAAVFLTAFVMLLFFSFAGIGAWLFLKGKTTDANTNLLLAKKDSPKPEVSATRTNDLSKPTPLTTLSPNAANTETTLTTADGEQIKKDVSAKVYSWKSAAEAHNLDSYMSNYADSVAYYNKTKTRAGVREDKQRAFTLYSSIQITLSNMNVTPDASGSDATATFDKQWIFSGEKYSEGKVKTQLQLKKINGQWLITGEKDLQIYYTKK